MKRKPGFQQFFRLMLLVTIVLLVGWGVIAGLRRMIADDLSNLSSQAQEATTELESIRSTPEYQKIAFASDLVANERTLPWSDHIASLIDVLTQVQELNDSSGPGTLELTEFSVSLDEIEISGLASSLATIYFPDTQERIGLIAAVSELVFLDDIRIQTYEKNDDNLYEFTLFATILLDD